MAKQITLKPFVDKIYEATAKELEERFDKMAYYATKTALTGGGRGDGVDTGAYVNSFSILKAGSGGGRSRTSNNKPTNQNPEVEKQKGYEQLQSDIQNLNIEQMIKSGNVKVVIRNRSPHAQDVENGTSWKSDGYGVFAKIKKEFG